MNIGSVRADAADVGQRHEYAEKLLGGAFAFEVRNLRSPLRGWQRGEKGVSRRLDFAEVSSGAG